MKNISRNETFAYAGNFLYKIDLWFQNAPFSARYHYENILEVRLIESVTRFWLKVWLSSSACIDHIVKIPNTVDNTNKSPVLRHNIESI